MTAYEITPWRTVGGSPSVNANPNYELESPWDGPAELILTQISGNGVGTVIISFDDNNDMSGLQTAITQGIPTPGARGMVIRVGANSPVTFSNDPIPIENRRVYLYIAPDTASNAIYVTAHWRRQVPDAGAQLIASQNLAATLELVAEQANHPETVRQWATNLATDNTSGSKQNYHRSVSQLRRSNSSKRQKSPSLLERLTKQ